MKGSNIIYILADDMGYGDVGCYNPSSKITTPNMDRLAREGVRCTDAHSPSSVCTPSRYGILTGRYCWRTPLKKGVLFNYEHPLIEPEQMTVASMLKQRGYDTACIGKWHLGLGWQVKDGLRVNFNEPLPWGALDPDPAVENAIDFRKPITGGPTELGFDWFFGTSGCSTAQPPYGFIENDRFLRPEVSYYENPVYMARHGAMSPGWLHEEADTIFTEKAVSYIASHTREKPDTQFFLYLAASAPHEPCAEETVPAFARNRSKAGPRGDLVWLFDWMVGQVTEAVEACGIADETLIIVTSDNGALPGNAVMERGEQIFQKHDHSSCGAWRGYKSHILEGGHRVPMIARWPGNIPPGTVCNELMCLGDLMATAADVAGATLPENAGEDSYSMAPALCGKQGSQPVREALIHHSLLGVFSIRKGDWKVVFDTKSSGGTIPPIGEEPIPGTPGQVYNLAQDPREDKDLWSERQDIVKEFTELFKRYLDSGRSVTR